MKLMSDGLQQSAGDRMRKTLNFMTGNRFIGLFTGFLVTAIIQSSSALSVIVVGFVNAGLLTLTQAIGVLLGGNIGTTLTAWIVSLIGFKVKISAFALPAIGIGFIFRAINWKHKSTGDFLLGFGFLFLGLDYLGEGFGSLGDIFDFNSIGIFRDMGYIGIMISVGMGIIMTIIINSSTAAVAIYMTMAFNNIISYEMAAGLVLGANIGTTTDAPLAAIGGTTEAKRTGLAHVMFKVIGVAWALPLIFPLLKIVDIVLPGDPTAVFLSPSGERTGNIAVTTHIAGVHTVFNVINTVILLPFVNQFARLVSLIIREKEQRAVNKHYKFTYLSTAMADSPELNVIRAEKEIRDMAGIAASMYARFSAVFRDLRETDNKVKATAGLCQELKQKEEYADEMRESLISFLIECTRDQNNPRLERRINQLLRVVSFIEEMTDDCYITSLLLEKNIQKNRVFNDREMEDLVPYLNRVEEFLDLLQEQLGQSPAIELVARSRELEEEINKSRKKLQKLSRKRIEAGKDVKTELFFIDLVRRIEKLGDYCFDISNTLGKLD